MRSRYTAHVLDAHAYLRATHAPPDGKQGDLAVASPTLTWTRLEITDTCGGGAGDDEGTVEFRAHYQTKNGAVGVHHERSRFRRVENRWVYVDGELVRPTPNPSAAKVGRNDACPCGSERKYKRCCGR